MGCPPALAAVLLPASPIAPGWKLMFPLTPVTPLFVMAGQVEQDPFFKTIVASGVFPGPWGDVGSAQLQWERCTAGTPQMELRRRNLPRVPHKLFLLPDNSLCPPQLLGFHKIFAPSPSCIAFSPPAPLLPLCLLAAAQLPKPPL